MERSLAGDAGTQPAGHGLNELGPVSTEFSDPAESAESVAGAKSAERARFLPLTLCDRAHAFLASREPVTEEALLAHVFGGSPPMWLRARLAEPLLADPRLERLADGHWAVVGRTPRPGTHDLRDLAFTALALVATGPNPGRGRVVQVAALHMHHGTAVERFSLTVNPGARVPRYVAERIGMATEVLEDLPPFASSLEDLVRFLGARPIVAQDARLMWAFVEAEARRLGQALSERLLMDANEIATYLLDLRGKPTLSLVAPHLGIGMHRAPRPDEEARVLGLVATRLLSLAAEQGHVGLEARDANGGAALRRRETAQALPELPGVYVMRDLDQMPVYVGKARRLRSRVAAYVHRPLGATRRLEGLVGAVESVDSLECETDLEALILEDREIRRLQPRFNTVRQQRTPRAWIRLPPPAQRRPAQRKVAAPRLELSPGPTEFESATESESAKYEFVGPFRNESLAAQAQLLARRVFALDTLRRHNRDQYAVQLSLAWSFLRGETDTAITYARHESVALLREVVEFDVQAALLPADPRRARYAVLRPTPAGTEGFLIDQGICQRWVPPRTDEEPSQFAAQLLADGAPRTLPEDRDVVLRWFGAQRPPARLVYLPEDPRGAAEAIEDAASSLSEWSIQAQT
jgi:DNA polymerase III epsilon subunit-like protein